MKGFVKNLGMCCTRSMGGVSLGRSVNSSLTAWGPPVDEPMLMILSFEEKRSTALLLSLLAAFPPTGLRRAFAAAFTLLMSTSLTDPMLSEMEPEGLAI